MTGVFIYAIFVCGYSFASIHAGIVDDETNIQKNSNDDIDTLNDLLKRVQNVIANQAERKAAERKQLMENEYKDLLLKKLAQMEPEDKEHLRQLLGERSLGKQRQLHWCPWCDIGSKLVRLITLLCKEKKICFKEFDGLVEETLSAQGDKDGRTDA